MGVQSWIGLGAITVPPHSEFVLMEAAGMNRVWQSLKWLEVNGMTESKGWSKGHSGGKRHGTAGRAVFK